MILFGKNIGALQDSRLIQVTYPTPSGTYNEPVLFHGVITMRLILTLTTALAVILASTNTTEACTIIAVGKDASADGSVLI